jgi:2-iminobutanoate/2-iminopropanoate deaminase
MSEIQRIQLPKKSTTQPLYCDAVKFGNMLWISGMLPTDGDGNIVGVGDAAAQAEQVFHNIKMALEAGGGRFEDIVKITIFLTDINLRSDIVSVRRKYFGDKIPASTQVEISRLANPDALIEVEAIACLGDK